MSTKYKKNWIIREAKDKDFESIRKLYKKVWGHQRPIQYDKWKFTTFAQGATQISIAIAGEDVVGAFMVAPINIKIGAEVVLGGVAMDVMSHPRYVGTRVFVDAGIHCTEKARKRGFKILYGFPNNNSLPGFIRRLNWDHTGAIAHWVRPLKLSNYPKVPKVLGPFVNLAANFLSTGSVGNYKVKIGIPRDQEIVALLKPRPKFDRKCQINRDTDWFYSRYSNKTYSHYEWVSVYKGDEISALGIWGMRNKRWGTGLNSRAQITELFGKKSDALLAVLSTIIARAKIKDAMLLETVTNDQKLEKVLRGCSFFKHNQIPLIVKDIGREELPTNIHHHPNWNIFGGDVDTF